MRISKTLVLPPSVRRLDWLCDFFEESQVFELRGVSQVWRTLRLMWPTVNEYVYYNSIARA